MVEVTQAFWSSEADARANKAQQEEQTEKTQRAWLLDFGHGFLAAVADHEMSQIRMEPSFNKVPFSPEYCDHVAIIGKYILPVIDLAVLLGGEECKREEDPEVLGVAVYQEKQGATLEYIGLVMAAMPQSLNVADSQACPLPDDIPLWQDISLSCFVHEGNPVPVLDLAHLFSAAFRDANNPKNKIVSLARQGL